MLERRPFSIFFFSIISLLNIASRLKNETKLSSRLFKFLSRFPEKYLARLINNTLARWKLSFLRFSCYYHASFLRVYSNHNLAGIERLQPLSLLSNPHEMEFFSGGKSHSLESKDKSKKLLIHTHICTILFRCYYRMARRRSEETKRRRVDYSIACTCCRFLDEHVNIPIRRTAPSYKSSNCGHAETRADPNAFN